MNAYICMQTHSTCYQRTSIMKPVGILWHSTGCNNPNIKRYVQPYKGDANYAEAIAKLGVNTAHNDWNHMYHEAGLNAWIGKFADGSVGVCQTMPWEYKPWGCGAAYKGGPSCNEGWIQFEICEDALKDKAYAQKTWDAAIELSVYLCKLYGLDPTGTATCGGKQIPVITCHNDASKLGCASGHSDINHWFPKLLGKNMQTARQEIKAKLAEGAPVEKKLYRVQTGAFKNHSGAQRLADQLEAKGFDAIIKQAGGLHRVQVGAYSKPENAKAMQKKLKQAGYTDAFITEG